MSMTDIYQSTGAKNTHDPTNLGVKQKALISSHRKNSFPLFLTISAFLVSPCSLFTSTTHLSSTSTSDVYYLFKMSYLKKTFFQKTKSNPFPASRGSFPGVCLQEKRDLCHGLKMALI